MDLMGFPLIFWEATAVLFLVILVFYSYRKRVRTTVLKKIYIERVDFNSLPEAGPESCFIGKIAKSKFAAFLELNQLLTHIIIGGSAGCGKTTAAQSLAEEALRSNIPVLVFDPTARWTGFLRENNNGDMIKLYPQFDMKEDSVQSFNGNIYVIKDPAWRVNIEKQCHPGEITIFCLHKLDPNQMNVFIENTIQKLFRANREESSKLKLLLIYEEIHMLLPQFGGDGQGLIQIGRAMREFRKWGIGIILVSQIISDLNEEIRANVSTEIQMRTTKSEDLKAVELKYGELISLGVAESPMAIGLIQNARYNRGEPYFINFRPPLHSPQQLDDKGIAQYVFYNSQISELEEGVEVFKRWHVDTFDIELELDLANSNIRKGNFSILDLYMDSLKSKIKNYMEKLRKHEISEEERVILSKWESKKEDELRSYEDELTKLLEERKEELSKKEKRLIQRQQEERRRIKDRLQEAEENERGILQELRDVDREVQHKSQVLNLLKKYQQQAKILNKEVMNREMEKLEIDQERVKNDRIRQRERILQERERILQEEREELGDMEYEKTFLEEETENIQKRLDAVHQDKRMVLERDERIRKKEEELVNQIKERIEGEIKTRKQLLNKGLNEEEEKIVELEKTQMELDQKLKTIISNREKMSREKRKELVEEKDKLYYSLQNMKEIWKEIITKEQQIRELKEELRIKEKEAEKQGETSSIREVRDKIEEKLNQLREGREKLSNQLEEIRKEITGGEGIV